MKLVVKVDPKCAPDPVAHVRELLRKAGDSGDVEEVFPDLREGSSAGLVTVTFPDSHDSKARQATLKVLRDDEAVAYVETPKARRHH